MARRAAAALACAVACAATSDTGPWWAYHELGEPVDVSRSLEAIRSVPIKRFEMTHDTVNGRVHYGVLAPDAEASLGPVYGETVTKEEAVPGAKGGLTRKVVDPGVLFTHGLAALQALSDGVPAALDAARPISASAVATSAGLAFAEEVLLDANWSTAAELKPLRNLEEARARTLETKLRKIDAKAARTRNVTRYDFATRNETSLQLDALAAATADFEHATARATLQHNANATRATDAVLEDMRKATALKKLRDEFTVAEARDRAAKESEIPNFKGSFLGRFPLVLADFWTSDRLSERSRSVDAFSGTRARGTLTLKRRCITLLQRRFNVRSSGKRRRSRSRARPSARPPRPSGSTRTSPCA